MPTLMYTRQLQEVSPPDRYPLLTIIKMELETYILFSSQDSQSDQYLAIAKRSTSIYSLESALKVS